MENYDFDLDLDSDNSLSKIINQIRPGTNVLEFGPATGRMTRYLKETLGCIVYIVELNKESAKKASAYAEETIVGDVEDYEWLGRWERNILFDYIIFADVLEHLRDPETVLSRTRRVLKENGSVIISVPNVAHNSIMINLYNNIFNYAPVGLLDRTHIHLFAYNSLKMMCENSGYYAVVEDAIYSNVGENEIQSDYSQLPAAIARYLKNRIYGSVYQFIFTLKKIDDARHNVTDTSKRIIPYPVSQRFKLYYDIGSGWVEENCYSSTFHADGMQKFHIPIGDIIDCSLLQGVCFKPSDDPCPVIIHKISITDKDGCRMIGEDEFFFEATPLIGRLYYGTDRIFMSPKKGSFHSLTDIEITMEFLADDYQFSSAILGSIRDKLETIESLKQTITSQVIELDRRNDELEHRMQLINELRNESDQYANQLKLSNEELERRAVELDHRMTEINRLREALMQHAE